MMQQGQPPSGGCVLKQRHGRNATAKHCQPPSGGCVLKLEIPYLGPNLLIPAAFGRLCVETQQQNKTDSPSEPAAFGRLCVETSPKCLLGADCRSQPPSGGCVLKLEQPPHQVIAQLQPPSGGCVLKLPAMVTS